MLQPRHGTVETPWGRLFVEVSERGLRRVSFDGPAAPLLTGPWAEAFAGYLAGQPFPADLPIDLTGVPAFMQRVLSACREIPFGSTLSYRALATVVGSPNAARAVGQAMARNPLPVVIPCHRVLGSDGRLTGFLGGKEWKLALLQHEGVRILDL
jgi:O-6-methylguanine DNA methyltransferase